MPTSLSTLPLMYRNGGKAPARAMSRAVRGWPARRMPSASRPKPSQ